MKRTLTALILLAALFSARTAAAVDQNIVSGTDFSTRLTVDSNSKAARVTEYQPDGTLTHPSAKYTYSASSGSFSPGTAPGDVCTITGSASMTIRVLSMELDSVQTTAGLNTWFIVKRSSNTGGTTALVPMTPHDSTNPVATAVVRQYTVNPTSTGTAAGFLWSGKIDAPAPATAGVGQIHQVVNFTDLYGQPVVLRGVNEMVTWSFNAAALPSGLSVTCAFTWTEE